MTSSKTLSFETQLSQPFTYKGEILSLMKNFSTATSLEKTHARIPPDQQINIHQIPHFLATVHTCKDMPRGDAEVSNRPARKYRCKL